MGEVNYQLNYLRVVRKVFLRIVQHWIWKHMDLFETSQVKIAIKEPEKNKRLSSSNKLSTQDFWTFCLNL